ncbi:MAG TPA: hypothetical protein VHK24_04615 [Steroidobacter sp.]|nr:hypothetical protein [Steroidobacter sp.]
MNKETAVVPQQKVDMRGIRPAQQRQGAAESHLEQMQSERNTPRLQPSLTPYVAAPPKAGAAQEQLQPRASFAPEDAAQELSAEPPAPLAAPVPAESSDASQAAGAVLEDRDGSQAQRRADVREFRMTESIRPDTARMREGETAQTGAPRSEPPFASDPQTWLEAIRELRRRGRVREAEEEWERFRAAYPDYPVSDAQVARPESAARPTDP